MILIGLGANLPTIYGGPQDTLRAALSVMPAFGIDVTRVSSFYCTPAMAHDVQPPYVNAVAVVRSLLPAIELLEMLHRIEEQFGRVRKSRWAPRTLDIDLLDYEGQIVTDDGPRGADAGVGTLPLALPHPGIAERGFVLVPLVELVPEWRHPVTGQDSLALLSVLKAAQGDAALAGIERISA
tara:strand:+ start:111708 stop:112253 length:546 start_codon:yes stop_codon:yes gene_type:complete